MLGEQMPILILCLTLIPVCIPKLELGNEKGRGGTKKHWRVPNSAVLRKLSIITYQLISPCSSFVPHPFPFTIFSQAQCFDFSSCFCAWCEIAQIFSSQITYELIYGNRRSSSGYSGRRRCERQLGTYCRCCTKSHHEAHGSSLCWVP